MVGSTVVDLVEASDVFEAVVVGSKVVELLVEVSCVVNIVVVGSTVVDLVEASDVIEAVVVGSKVVELLVEAS